MRARVLLVLAIAALTPASCRRAERPAPAEPVDAFFAQQGRTRAQAWGRHVYDLQCAVCHGLTGHGDGKNAYTLEPQPPDFSIALRAHPPSYWRRVITDGTVSVGRSPLCPARGRTLTADDVDGLVAYLELLERQEQPRLRNRRRSAQ
jgi:mono/diheme cytochrome c family protein